MSGTKLKAFECGVKGTEWKTVVHHISRSKAKYRYWQDVREPWPDVKIMDITCRSLGNPRPTKKFEHTAQYRGVTFKIGDEVVACGNLGLVMDSNSSANFEILFTEGKWNGRILSCHPSEIKPIPARPTREMSGKGEE